MPQLARPVADIANSGWTPQPLYHQLDEVTADDSTVVVSGDDPQTDTFEVKLAETALPGPGPQQLVVRLRKTTAASVPVAITLLQGSRVIAFRIVQPAQAFTDHLIELTAAEVARITSYADLRVRVAAAASTLVLEGTGGVSYAPADIFSPASSGGVKLEGDSSVTYIGTEIFSPASSGGIKVEGTSSVTYISTDIFSPASSGEVKLGGDGGVSYTPGS